MRSSNTLDNTCHTPNSFNLNADIDLSTTTDFDFLIQDPSNAAGDTSKAPYTNLGFEGGQHDFDDGAPGMPDLFGGFFFGGPMPDPNEINISGGGIPQLQRMDTMLVDTGNLDGSGSW